MKKFIQFLMIISLFVNVGACSEPHKFITWQEEVRLNDGRVIIVSQKKAYNRGIDRDAYLTINLPEFSSQPIVWHERLSPLVVNVDKGRLYVIGFPPTIVEFQLYGSPFPAYVGFVWENERWKRIRFDEIPNSIYRTNMLIEGFPPRGTSILTIDRKESGELNGNSGTPYVLRRLDPRFKYPQ